MMSIHFGKQPQRSSLLPAAIAAPISALVGLVTGYLLFRGRRPRAAFPATGKRVDQAMTRDPRSIAPLTPVSEAARVMRSQDVGSVPVVDDGRLVGMVTDRDIALRLVAEGKDPQATPVAEVASAEIVTVRPEQELDSALQLMAQHQVRRLPVVENDRLVGIVAQADVAVEAPGPPTALLVEEISQPTHAA
jgi:CBS domain-containing protein